MTRYECAACRRTLEISTDIYGVQPGVLGTQGQLVPLEEPTILCSDTCIRDYFHPLPNGPVRRP